MCQALRVQRLQFETTFCETGRVSRNWGPTLRGGFGSSLRRVSCSLGRDSCKDCPLGAACPYGYVFETPILGDEAIMRKYPQAPHPFVFEPNLQGKAWVKVAEGVQNCLVVIGEAVRYLPYLFLAIKELGRNGLGRDGVGFQVSRFATEDGTTVYDRTQGRGFRPAVPSSLSLEPGEPRNGHFTLRFESPARIVVDGRVTPEPSLEDIVKSLCRRVFLLRYFHCGRNEERLSDDFIEAAKDARRISADAGWEEATRYSTRQERQVPIGGFVGRLTYEGDIGLLRPLLRAGEYVHVGKNATFGLGKYVLTEGA